MKKLKRAQLSKSLAPILALLLLLPLAARAELKSEDRKNGLSSYGRLSVQGTRLCAEDGTPIVLRGVSSHGLTWFPEYTSYPSLKTLREYGANVFRVAVYPAQNDGYLEEPELNRKLLYAAIENALAADMYVVVDWHVLQDKNPLKHKEKAAEFFKDVTKRYQNEPGIIYEICNEPNGSTSYQDIAKYARTIIPVIRKYSPDAVILVGTPKFCTTLEDAIKDPLPYKNVMYTYHYYSNVSDCRYARSQISKALENEIPVFVSEWGYVMGSKTEKKDREDLDAFLNLLDENGVSWINWSLSNKNEKLAFLREDVTALSGWTEDQLTSSGEYVVSRLKMETETRDANIPSQESS